MPASKFPVKRYNYLVPGIFPLAPPAVDEDLPPWIGKKLEKLHEYIQLNPKNTAKVSRRLERRIRSELKSKARLGYVKIAVHAYVYLLAHSDTKDVILYAEELITKDDAVIEILLKNKSLHLNILGAELLAHFLTKQSDSVNFNRLESLVPVVCQLCRSMSRKENVRQRQSLEDKKLRLELRVACLRSLREHVALMHKLLVPLGEKETYLENIMSCILDNLGSKEIFQVKLHDEATEVEASNARPSSPVARVLNGLNPLQHKNTFLNRKPQAEASTSFDFAFTVRTGNFGDDFMTSDGPSAVAAQVLRELGLLTRAARSAERILTVLLNQLDERHGWQGAEIVSRSFDVMHEAFAREHQQFLLFKILLKHAAKASHLPFPERISVIKIALEEGLSQDSQLAVIVLGQCLDCLHHQLPKPKSDVENELIPVATDFSNMYEFQENKLTRLATQQALTSNDQDEEMLRTVILSGIAQIARKVEGSMQLVDTLLGVLDKRDHTLVYQDDLKATKTNLSLFECVFSAAQALSDLPEGGGRLPIRMFDSTIYQLLGMAAELPPAQAVYVEGILRMILLVGPKEMSLSEQQNHSVLSSIYNGLKNTTNSPHNFSEMSVLFYTLMSKSTIKEWSQGLQFIHSLWKQALNESKESGFYDFPSTHVMAILFLANQCLVTIGKLLGSEELAEARLPQVKEALEPSLKPSRQFGGVLAYSAEGFNSEVNQKCSVVLDNLRAQFKDQNLLERIFDGIKDTELMDEELKEVIEKDFTPEEQQSFVQRQKFGIGRSGTTEDVNSSRHTDPGTVEEYYRKVYWMYNKSKSARNSSASNAERFNSMDRLSSGCLESEETLNKTTTTTHDSSEKSREGYLRELLNSPSDIFDSSKLPDHQMEYPQVGYIP